MTEEAWFALPPESKVEVLAAALQASHGDPAKAAGLLNLPERHVLNTIAQNEPLRKTWGVIPPTEIPTEAESFAGGTSEMYLQVALRMQVEDAALKRGLAGIGLTDAEADTAVALSQLSRDNFKPSLQVVNGSVTGACVKLFKEMGTIIERLAAVRTLMGTSAKTDEGYLILMEEEDKLQGHLTATVDCLNQIQRNAIQAAAIMAQVESGGQMKSAKKGFSPAPIELEK